MVQLLGTGLLIKGRQIVNESGDGSFNKISASNIDIRSGGVNITGSSNITGSLNVQGTISGDVISSLPQNILEKKKDCLVSLLGIFGQQQKSFTGIFIRPDGWIITNYSSLITEEGDVCLDVWGTIRNPTENKKIDVIKAHHIFVDEYYGLCVIKFPDIENHCHVNWAKDSKPGDNCYSVNYNTSISHGLIHSRLSQSILLDYMCASSSVILDARGDLVSICNYKHEESGIVLVGGCSPIYAKHSSNFMINNLEDYEITKHSSLGMNYEDVNALHIVTSGSLGIIDVSGAIIIDSSTAYSGNIIKSIDDVETSCCDDLDFYILQKKIGDEVKLKYITPPSTEEHFINISIVGCEKNATSTTSTTAYSSSDKWRSSYSDFIPMNLNYQSMNANNMKVIYEETHEEEIKYRKKMYLVDRLRNVKNRKKSRPRVRSRKR